MGTLHDLRHAARTLTRAPGFSAAVILTLGLGIGANTGMFSFVYGILLRPLPYEQADRLVVVEAERDVSGVREPVRSYFPLADLALFRRLPPFEAVAFYATDQGVLSIGGRTEAIDFAVVSDGFFATVARQFSLGRPLDSADAQRPSLVISDRVWRRAFAASPDIIGRAVVLNSSRGDGAQRAAWRRLPFTIVGVADDGFQFPSAKTDAWVPAEFVRSLSPRCCSFSPIASVKDGLASDRIQAEAANISRELGAANPGYADLRIRIVGLREALVRSVRPSLLMLFAAVALVLCVACANTMNLLIARHASRAREMAIRLALGASRWQLMRQSVLETGLLAAMGGTAGVLVAIGVVKTLPMLGPVDIPRVAHVRVDGAVLAFTCATVVFTMLLTGIVPALQSIRVDALRIGGVGAPRTIAATRIRRAATIGQIAISVVLLVGALLLGRSLIRLLHSDLGIDVDHAVAASLSLSLNRELSGRQQVHLVERLLTGIEALPGVSAAGIGTVLPPTHSRIVLTLRGTNALSYQAAAIPATPGYFPALRIRLLKGRFFTDADDEESPPVMIMSADAARHFFGDGDPLGQTLSLPVFRDGAQRHAVMTLVGVIADVKYSGLDRPADNAIFRPFAQQPWPNVFLIARTSGDTGPLLPSIQRAVALVDPAIAVASVKTLDAVVLDAAAQPRLRTVITAALAVLTLALAAVGLYGIVSRSVTQRTNEIGLRMALGATGRDILRMVVGEGMILATVGVVLGLGLGYAAARSMAAMLYGVGPSDTASFAAASGSLLLFALAASYVPARRAAAIDPALALRAE